MGIFYIFLAIILVWMAALSYLLFRALGSYNRLTKGLTDKTLSEVLKKVLDQNELAQSREERVLSQMSDLKLEARQFIKKIGLVRFNPFSDTGGDQSFVLAILDGQLSGIVITSLYARTGTRWYVKTVKQGKATEYELSQEEQEAIKKASKV
jgi:hypothetical protein